MDGQSHEPEVCQALHFCSLLALLRLLDPLKPSWLALGQPRRRCPQRRVSGTFRRVLNYSSEISNENFCDAAI